MTHRHRYSIRHIKADNYYSLDDSAADYTMANLTLARDKEKLLPYIKVAMAVNPDLKVWGSPWTGPWYVT